MNPLQPLTQPLGELADLTLGEISEDELDQLQQEAHQEETASVIASELVLPSRFHSTDKQVIAEKLRKRIEKALPEAIVTVRIRRSTTIELEEGEPLTIVALRETLERLFTTITWQENQFQIPWTI